jgi:hypothetical protein
VGPGAGPDAVSKRKKFQNYPCRESNPDRPDRSLVSILIPIIEYEKEDYMEVGKPKIKM